MPRTTHVLAAAGLALTLGAAPALGADYPPPGRPGGSGKVAKPKGKHRTLHVGKGKGAFKTVQKAVKAANAGDTIKVADGTYKEGVLVTGRKKSYLKIIGDVKDPSKVTFNGKGVKGIPAQNAIAVNGADEVTLKGMTARNYLANGFFVRSAYGYTLDHLQAFATGTYGIYAFDTIGGTMTNDVAAWNNDSGFYVGQTPPQKKPERTIIDNVASFGNVLGYSGTNSRYVTIRNSKWFDNGLGIVPNTLKSEKYAPQEDNVITGNEVFWNNFNYYNGAPFQRRKGASSFEYPPGTGILIYGGRNTVITSNHVFGNFLVGIGGVSQFDLAGSSDPKLQAVAPLSGMQVTGNTMDVAGADKNGRDIFMDGSGADNCASDNPGATTFETRKDYTIPACPFTGSNGGDPKSAVFDTKAVGWVTDPTHEANWLRVDHSAQTVNGKPAVPLEEYKDYKGTDTPPGRPCIVTHVPDKDTDPSTTSPC